MNPAHDITSPCPHCGRPADRSDYERCLTAFAEDCNTVLSLGSGLGDDLAPIKGKKRVGVEIFQMYVDEARVRHCQEGLEFIVCDAREFIRVCGPYDLIQLCDFLEHLGDKDAEEMLKQVIEKATKRVVVFCPEGFVPQKMDTYGLGADLYQTHRSGWTAERLESWGFDVARWEKYHWNDVNALFAVRDRP